MTAAAPRADEGAAPGRGKGGAPTPGSRTVEVPRWVQALYMAVVAASSAAVLYLAPRHFARELPPGERAWNTPVSYVNAGVPFFLLLIAVELALHRASRVAEQSPAAAYDLADSWGSISAGLTQQMVAAVVLRPAARVLPMHGYVWVWEHLAPAAWRLDEASGWTWLAAFVAADFSYYWAHRVGHSVAPFWAGHSVHHSSEHYNLSTALRQSWFQGVYGPLLYLPFALAVPPRVLAVQAQLNTLYQFYVHTCCVRRLPAAFELVFSTPSHHRVHHDRRVHRNFGGILIVWDRLFGSFTDEDAAAGSDGASGEACVFGILRPVRTWAEGVLQCAEWPRVLRSPLRGPGWYTVTGPRRLRHGGAPARQAAAVGSDTTVSERLRLRSHLAAGSPAHWYLVAHGLLLIALAYTQVLTTASTVPLPVRAAFSAGVLVSLYSGARLLDGAPRAPLLEAARCAAAAAAFWALPLPAPSAWSRPALAAFHAASAVAALAAPAALLGRTTLHVKRE